MRVLALLIFFMLTACGGTEPVVPEQKIAIKNESSQQAQMSADDFSYEQICAELNGLWDPVSKFDLHENAMQYLGSNICNLPAPDAGKVCSDSDNCIGRCLANDPRDVNGTCSPNWFVAANVFTIETPDRHHDHPQTPKPIPDNLYSDHIERIEAYVINRQKWTQLSIRHYSYIYDFDAGLVVSINLLPARLTVKDGIVTSAEYLGEDGLRPDGEPPIKTGDIFQWLGGNPLDLHLQDLPNQISRAKIVDLLDIQYHPEAGIPVYIEADSKNISDSYVQIKINDFKILTNQ